MIAPTTFIVEGAGTASVNGTYSRAVQQVGHADIWRKQGSTLALLRYGDKAWSLADLKSVSCGWSLRAEELYRAERVPAGDTPPNIGWKAVFGRSPAPLIKAGKALTLRDSVSLKHQSVDIWPQYGTSRATTMLSRTGSATLLPDIASGAKPRSQKTVQEEDYMALYTATQSLEQHVLNRQKPGAGFHEQNHVREVLAGTALPSDHQLVLKATELLKTWQAQNSALRAEARLQKAEHRAARGFHKDEPHAGEMLASAITEVSEQGVDQRLMDRAQQTLKEWRQSRLKVCVQDLLSAMQFKDEEFLKDSIHRGEEAGVDAPLLRGAIEHLTRLRTEDEVNRSLEEAMEDGDLQLLELAIQRGHSGCYDEEQFLSLRAAVLQFHLRFVVEEFRQVLKTKLALDLEKKTQRAEDLLVRCKETLHEMQKPGGSEVAFRTLERDARSLELMMGRIREFRSVQAAECAIKRVLGAVERYAAELPEVIMRGKQLLSFGLNSDLMEQCEVHLQAYRSTIKELEHNISDRSKPLALLKAAFIRARLAGGPQELLDRAAQRLKEEDTELWKYTEMEMELLVAIREADDVEELSVEHRFLRLQTAAEKGKKLRPALAPEVLSEVDRTSVALAVERMIQLNIADAEDVLACRREADPDEVAEYAESLQVASTSCEESGLDEVKKKMLPKAQALCAQLEEEQIIRRAAQARVSMLTGKSPAKDLREVLMNARERFVPERYLTSAYSILRKRKLESIGRDMISARVAGDHQRALALWYRGKALDAHLERNGKEWQADHTAELTSIWANGITVQGEFRGSHCGGSFGTQTWRQNPRYIIRPKVPSTGDEEESSHPKGSLKGISVRVYVVEAATSPATLSIHAVRNKHEVAEAGCGYFMAPGFEVVGSPQGEDELPRCEFELGALPDDTRPVLVVPSAAQGEEGPFTLLIEASAPVEVVEATDGGIDWQLRHEVELEWKAEWPQSIAQGGGRIESIPPRLSWYRNPQFGVALPERSTLEEEGNPEANTAGNREGPLLLALLVSGDRRQPSPAAVHILQNTMDAAEPRVIENPLHHIVLAQSGTVGGEYAASREVGVLCKLPADEAVFVVPSLEKETNEGKYTLRLYSTAEILVTRAA